MELFFALKKPSVVVEAIKADMVHNILKYWNSLLFLCMTLCSANLGFIYFHYSNDLDSGNVIIFANLFMIVLYLSGLFILQHKKYRTHKKTAFFRFVRNYMFMCTWVSLLYCMTLVMCWILVKIIFEFHNFYLNFDAIYYGLNFLVLIFMAAFTFINLFISGLAE